MKQRVKQQGFGLMEVLLAVLLSALALSALLAVLFRGMAGLREAEERASAVRAAENLAQSIISNPVFEQGNVQGKRSFSHYIARVPAASCNGNPSDGITPEDLAAFHLCRLQQEWAQPLHEVQTAFTVCYDDSGEWPEWQGALPDFRCGGSSSGIVAVKLVWKRGGEVFSHRFYIQE